MAITEDTGRTGTAPWSRAEKAIAAVIALVFAVVSAGVGAVITEALSQLF